jgi:hypothetical protein
MFSFKPETWIPCTGSILISLKQPVGGGHLQLTFTPPANGKTQHGLRTRDLALMVKLETLQENGAYTGAVYMLKATPDSQYPLAPVQEAPEAAVTWWQLRQPFITMEGF